MTTLLAYLAGAIDSDGSIGIRRSTYAQRVRGDAGAAIYSERVTLRQVTPQIPDLLKATFGGYLGIHDSSAKRGRPLYSWQVTDRKAAQCVSALLPFLLVKREQALNCLALREVKERSAIARVAKGRGHMGSAARSQELTDEMEALFVRAKELNRVGI